MPQVAAMLAAQSETPALDEGPAFARGHTERGIGRRGPEAPARARRGTRAARQARGGPSENDDVLPSEESAADDLLQLDEVAEHLRLVQVVGGELAATPEGQLAADGGDARQYDGRRKAVHA